MEIKTENLYAKHSVRTFTGRYVDLLNPDPETISIEDIAHGLAHMPRFCGQLHSFYSVAQHCVFCIRALDAEHKDPEAMEVLLHDASEAYLSDIPGPIKSHLPDYTKIENNLMQKIFEKFNIKYPLSKTVKAVDKYALEFEWQHIMLRKDSLIDHWRPLKAKRMFLNMYDKIKYHNK